MDYSWEDTDSTCYGCGSGQGRHAILSNRAAIGTLQVGKIYCDACLERTWSPCCLCKSLTCNHSMIQIEEEPIKWMKLCHNCQQSSNINPDKLIQAYRDQVDPVGLVSSV